MRRRLLAVAGLLLTLAATAASAGSAGAYFWDRSRADRIAAGVTVAGIDVGGLRASEARAKVASELARRLARPIRLVYPGHRFVIRPQRSGLRVDVDRMIGDAVGLTRAGGLAHRLLREVRGQQVDAAVPLAAGLSSAHVATVAARVAHALDRPPRSARIVPRPLATGVRIVPARAGLAVKRPALERALTAAILRIDGPRTIEVPTHAVAPRVWTSRLPHRYGTLILVSRETFTLRLFKRLKLVKTYRIAVGRAGLETPAGFYTIDDKQVNPSWHVPLSSWAGSLAGRVIPPGPDDPIKARWLGFYNGAGIHGTTDTWSLGSAASHGCVRMAIPDVEELYALVPLHTPIYVG